MPKHTQKERRKNKAKKSKVGNRTVRTAKELSSSKRAARNVKASVRGEQIGLALTSGLAKSKASSRKATDKDKETFRKNKAKLKANAAKVTAADKRVKEAKASKSDAKESSVAAKKKASTAQKKRRSNIGKKSK